MLLLKFFLDIKNSVSEETIHNFIGYEVALTW